MILFSLFALVAIVVGFSFYWMNIHEHNVENRYAAWARQKMQDATVLKDLVGKAHARTQAVKALWKNKLTICWFTFQGACVVSSLEIDGAHLVICLTRVFSVIYQYGAIVTGYEFNFRCTSALVLNFTTGIQPD